MNYADLATEFLDRSNEAEKGATWRSEELMEQAYKEVSRLSVSGAAPAQRVVLLAHDRLKERDREYQGHVSDNKFYRSKATANALLALIHGHAPTNPRSQG